MRSFILNLHRLFSCLKCNAPSEKRPNSRNTFSLPSALFFSHIRVSVDTQDPLWRGGISNHVGVRHPVNIMEGRVIISRLKFDIERRGKGWKALCGLTIITRLGPSTSTRNEEAITFLANLLVRRSDCSWGEGKCRQRFGQIVRSWAGSSQMPLSLAKEALPTPKVITMICSSSYTGYAVWSVCDRRLGTS